MVRGKNMESRLSQERMPNFPGGQGAVDKLPFCPVSPEQKRLTAVSMAGEDAGSVTHLRVR